MPAVSPTCWVTLREFHNFPDLHMSPKQKGGLAAPTLLRGTGCVIRWNNEYEAYFLANIGPQQMG